jgi:Zn-dependent M28 family amino/carboxypeptidase
MVKKRDKIIFTFLISFIFLSTSFIHIEIRGQPVVPGISQSNINYQLGNITSFETRRAGTSEGNQSAEYIFSYLNNLSLLVNYEYFDSYEGVLINVVAEIPGNNNSDEIIVLGAHYDTINAIGKSYPAPGANDNGASVAILLELGRILSNYTFDRGIRIIFFGGEEIGRIGSLNWIEDHTSEIDKILVALIIDMVAYSDKLIIDYNPTSKWMADYIKENTSISGLNFDIEENYYLSDQTRFWDKGITSLLIHHENPTDYPFYHSAYDTEDKLNMTMTYLTAELVLESVFILAGDTNISARNGINNDTILIIIIGCAIVAVITISLFVLKNYRS